MYINYRINNILQNLLGLGDVGRGLNTSLLVHLDKISQKIYLPIIESYLIILINPLLFYSIFSNFKFKFMKIYCMQR